MFKHDCKKHGHRFEARYSEEATGVELSNAYGTGVEAMKLVRDLMVLKVYECDICRYCGKIINNTIVCCDEKKGE
jgi:hypothetical protein